MKNKTITITLIAILTLSSFGLLFTTLLTPAVAGFSPIDLSTMEPYAIGATPEMLGEKEIAIREYAAEVGAAEATQASPIGEPATIGEEFTVTVSDMGLGIDYDETFVVVMDGTHGIILIEKAAYDSFDGTNYYFPNPYGNGTLPWYRFKDVITHLQLDYLLDQFDSNIYPTNTEIFGEPLPRGDEGQKVWVLIHNIRGDSYYDMENQTSYIAGYFSSSEDAANNKNMMHIDSYDWDNRVGPGVARPYLYEGVFAHEFQHLIHFDQDPDEPSWVDEGCADLAMFMCGYGHSSGHIANYFYWHEITALTFWGGQLEDYGACYLFALYLYEHYGGADFFTALLQEQANGIKGIENTLATLGYTETFDEIFDDWTIANYIDDTRKAGGKYGYETLDVGTIDTWGYSIEYVLSSWVGPPFDFTFGLHSSWLYGDPQPYTAHYYRFTNEDKLDVWIDGADTSGTPAYSGTYEWYSGADAWAWRSFNQTFDIPAGGANLNFYTFYEIEGDWDYGYVEVHDLDTGEWYTLDAPGTVDYVAHDQDNPNTPDDREPTAYKATNRWHAFTGYSGGWIPVSMDLTSFAGHSIDIYFTIWQDGAFTLQNMYVDYISIPEIGFFDDVEAGEDSWTTTGWYVTDGILDNGWSVSIIDTKWVANTRYPEPIGNNAMRLHSVKNMVVDYGTQSGILGVSATPAKSNRVKIAIVSNQADHILTSDYWFGVE